MRRITAWVVISLGAVVILAEIVAVVYARWHDLRVTSVPRVLVLLLVAIGITRAVQQLRRPASTGSDG